MRVLISGGAGFIGSHLCDRFVERGHDVVAVDNLTTGRESNIAHLVGNPAFEFVRADITETLPVKGEFDAILDFASPASPVDFERMPVEILKVGSFGVYNLLELARSQGTKFLQASTSEVYGDPLVHPQTEDYWGNVNPIGTRAPYDESKRFAEALVSVYHRKHGLDTRIARIFNTYGPRMREDDGRVVPQLIPQALDGRPLTVYGDGNQTRSFCFISDMVDGIYRLLESDTAEPVNLGNPIEFTVNEFARLVLELTVSKSEVRHLPLPKDDPRKRRPDITRARTMLGWEPKVALREGLALTIEWFKEQRSSRTDGSADTEVMTPHGPQ
jgi:dTDP-glucose 4,6-dehydratase